MSQFFSIHPTHPQGRLVGRAAEIVTSGGVIVVPTDATYVLACRVGEKQALERIREIRRLDKRHHFTLVCQDLGEIALYARVSNASYRIVKKLTPGPYTFVLPATREVPRRLVHPRRRTIGLRVPDSAVLHALLQTCGQSLLATSLRLPGQTDVMTDPEQMRVALEHQVDLIVDGGAGGRVPTTVLDLTGDAPVVTRTGKGEFEPG